jgi:hypothetical protein
LATVALWRVALLMVFLKRGAGLSPSAATVASLLPLALIVTGLVVLNLEKAVFDVMGGNRQPTQNDAAYFVLLLISMLSIFATPVLLILCGFLVYDRQRYTGDRAQE